MPDFEPGPNGYPSWKCPLCFDVIEGVGPTTIRLGIAEHIRTRHEQGKITPQQEGFHWHGDPAKADILIPLDDAFYNGARLTPFDKGFLRTLKLAWNPQKRLA